MRRSALSRVFATFVAAWFAIAANQPAVFGCTMAAGASASAPMHHASHAMAMAGMEMQGEMPSRDSHAPHAPGGAPQDCCSGFGSCGGAAAVPTASEVAVLAASISNDARPFRADERPARIAGDVRLPFSNGPPSEIGTA